MEIFLARLSPEGTIMASDIRITDTEGSEDLFTSHHGLWPSLAWNSCEYGLLWAHYWNGAMELRFARLEGNGMLIGPDIMVADSIGSVHYEDGSLSLGGGIASLAWSGSAYGAAWSYKEDNFEIFFDTISCN